MNPSLPIYRQISAEIVTSHFAHTDQMLQKNGTNVEFLAKECPVQECQHDEQQKVKESNVEQASFVDTLRHNAERERKTHDTLKLNNYYHYLGVIRSRYY